VNTCANLWSAKPFRGIVTILWPGSLLADGTIMAVKFLLGHAPAGGYYTPSRLMGARCVELLPGSTPIRVD